MGDEIGQSNGWYFNVVTRQVEPEGQSKAKDLLGPYPTREAAANALQNVHDREERLDSQDREWRDGAGR